MSASSRACSGAFMCVTLHIARGHL
jgi:hypothetical protein